MEDAYVDGHQGVGSGWEDLESAHHAQQKASTTEEAPVSYIDRRTQPVDISQPLSSATPALERRSQNWSGGSARDGQPT